MSEAIADDPAEKVSSSPRFDVSKTSTVRQVPIFEIDYSFYPSEKLSEILGVLAYGEALYIDLDAEDPAQVFEIVKDHQPGFRVRVAETSVYIAKGTITSRSEVVEHLKVHQKMLMAGWYTIAPDDVSGYWSKADHQYDASEGYLAPIGRSKFLLSVIEKHCSGVRSALEIGCNIGRNINFLKEMRNIDVGGIEISQHAIDVLRKNHPSLSNSQLFVGDAQEAIKSIPDNSFDLLFSMAVLMHISPDKEKNECFWRDIVRVSKQYIITIEDEQTSSNRNWARNYGGIFASLGCELIYSDTPFSDFSTDPDLDAFGGYTLRVFRV